MNKTLKILGVIGGLGLIIFFLIGCLFIFLNVLIFKNVDFTGLDRMIFAGRDSFYVGATGDYWYQIPIIEPYYIKQYPKWSNRWDMQLLLDHDNRVDILYNHNVINDIEKFSVENRVILIYTEYVPIIKNDKFQYKLTPWYVLIPDQKIETGFENEEDFKAYIQQLGISNPRWIMPDDAIHKFWETECLYWIPDCSK